MQLEPIKWRLHQMKIKQHIDNKIDNLKGRDIYLMLTYAIFILGYFLSWSEWFLIGNLSLGGFWTFYRGDLE